MIIFSSHFAKALCLLAHVPLLTASVVFCASVRAGVLDQVRATHVISIAHRDASLPFSYLDADKKPVGYAVDICLRVAEAVKHELGLTALSVKWVQVTSASRIPTIVEGKAAMECGSTTNTAARRKQVDFTIQHFIAASRFLVRVDSGIDNISGLENKTVVSTTGTTNLPTLRRLDREQDLHMKILEAKDHNEAFEMVVDKKADAFAMDDVLLYGLRANAKNPKLYKVIGKPMTIEPYAIMLPKDDPAFKAVVDRELRRLISSGEIYTLYQRWFEQPIPPHGVNMELPMPNLLRDALRYPSDKVGDLTD
jgi:ABC-type amino acid transport substrate-binding protein